VAPKLLDSLANPPGDLSPCLVRVVPCADGLCIPGQDLEPGKWCSSPVNSTDNHRDDTRLACVMSRYSTPHFDIVAVVRSKEVGAHQKENNVCCLIDDTMIAKYRQGVVGLRAERSIETVADILHVQHALRRFCKALVHGVLRRAKDVQPERERLVLTEKFP
jgi:hypothetical protein